MIILDTNVVSELIGPRPAGTVLAWFAGYHSGDFWITSITRAELLFGVEVLPDGRRRDRLNELLNDFFSTLLHNDVLPFSSADAPHYAKIAALRRQSGRPVGELDAQIAAIARRHQFAVATRNVRDFENCGIEVINPWAAE